MLLNAGDHVLKHLKSLFFIHDQRILLGISPESDAFLQVIHGKQVILPEGVDRVEHHIAFQLSEIFLAKFTFLFRIELKGSGSNGVNSVYQVGPAGALANGNNLGSAVAITILPGFNAISQKVAESPATFTPTPHPFGIWFADAGTLFVADEGDGVRPGGAGKVTLFAGLGQYKLVNGTWTRVATFQAGLLDQPAYTAGLPWNIKADGLRNIAGKANGDGSFTIYATTSTVSDDTAHDAGADPNQLVAITIGASSTPANTSFKVLQTAKSGERFGGVALVP